LAFKITQTKTHKTGFRTRWLVGDEQAYQDQDYTVI